MMKLRNDAEYFANGLDFAISALCTLTKYGTEVNFAVKRDKASVLREVARIEAILARVRKYVEEE